MLRGIRVPLLLQSRIGVVPRTFYRPLAVAAAQSIKSSISPKLGATATFLDEEPQGPNVITEIPGPKVKAAKDAMGKIQDVHYVDGLADCRFGR